jgi:hypothetical protein
MSSDPSAIIAFTAAWAAFASAVGFDKVCDLFRQLAAKA